MSDPQTNPIEPKLQSARPLRWAIFVFFLALYLVTMPNIETTSDFADPKYMFWVCQSLVDDGDVNLLNQGIKDVYERKDYALSANVVKSSKFPIGPSLVGIPFYVMAKWWSRLSGRTLNNNDLFYATSFSSPVITALVCLLLFQFILAMGFSPRAASLSACCYGLATIAWPEAFWLATEPLTALGILAAVYTAYLYKIKGRHYWLYLSGFFSGVAILARDVSILIVPLLLGYLLAADWQKARQVYAKPNLRYGMRLIIFLLGLVPFLVLNLWYTFARYGLSTNVGYLGYGGTTLGQFTTPLFVGLYGLLFSPGLGLFLFCPVLVFTFFSIKSFYTKHKSEAILFFSIFLIHLLLYAKYDCWYGGTCFGPRYLAPTIPLLVVAMAPFLQTLPARSSLTKLFALLVFGMGVMVQTAGYWGVGSSEWKAVIDSADKLLQRGDELSYYLPQSYPLLSKASSLGDMMDSINQFYFAAHGSKSLRFPIFVILLSTIFGAGFYLIIKLHLVPNGKDLRSFAVRTAAGYRRAISIFRAHKSVAYTGAVMLLILVSATYASFRYVLIPLMHYNSRPFGNVESLLPMQGAYGSSALVGKLEVSGWVLDRSAIRAVAIYIDNEKVADANYGEPSPYPATVYPYLPNSDRAGFVAAGIDTSPFSDGMHILRVKAQTQKGAWTEVEAVATVFVNKQPYDFWSHLKDAKTDAVLEDTVLTINQESRRVLLQPPGSEVTFENIPVHEGARLKLGIGIAHQGESTDSSGILLEIVANASIPLFSTRIGPEAYQAEQPWQDELIDLSQFQNRVISLTLTAKPESGGEAPSSRIGWSTMNIIYPDREKNPESQAPYE